jgi:hypothetical protein
MADMKGNDLGVEARMAVGRGAGEDVAGNLFAAGSDEQNVICAGGELVDPILLLLVIGEARQIGRREKTGVGDAVAIYLNLGKGAAVG